MCASAFGTGNEESSSATPTRPEQEPKDCSLLMTLHEQGRMRFRVAPGLGFPSSGESDLPAPCHSDRHCPERLTPDQYLGALRAIAVAIDHLLLRSLTPAGATVHPPCVHGRAFDTVRSGAIDTGRDGDIALQGARELYPLAPVPRGTPPALNP